MNETDNRTMGKAICSSILFLTLLTPVFGKDHKLLVIAIADWKGFFTVNEDGRGGFAALRNLVESRKLQYKAEKGSVLLLHAGNLTDAASLDEFTNLLSNRYFSLVDLMGFSHLNFSSVEANYIVSSKLGLPWVSLDSQGAKRYQIVPQEDYRFLISGYTKSNPSVESWLTMSKKQTGVDLLIGLLQRGNREKLTTLLDPIDNIHDSVEKKIPRYFIEPSEESSFFRTEDGSYVCQITGRDICETEFHFRNHRLLGSNSKIWEINSTEFPSSFIPNDPLLMYTLRNSTSHENRMKPQK